MTRKFHRFMVILALCSPLALTTVVAADYTLGIFGNANMDDVIDESDIEYVRDIIAGVSEPTKLADANCDGNIDEEDVSQIEMIIAGDEEELTIIDSYNWTVTIKTPVQHIVSMSLYCNEALRIFGDMDWVIAVNDPQKAPVYFPQMLDLPSIGGYPPDKETIFSFQPDMVLGATSWTKLLYDEMPGDIPVVGFDFMSHTPNEFAEETVKLGYIMNRRDEACDYLNNFHDKYLETIKSRTEYLSDDDKPRVYVESSFGEYKAYGGNGSGAQTYIEITGGENIFEDFPLYFEADPEAVMVKNPDIIIKQLRYDAGYSVDDLGALEAAWEEIMNRPELTDVSAVKSGRVYVIYEGLSYGFNYPIAVAYMAKWTHPELFEDLDPQAMHQEYVDGYCSGLDFDVYQQGAFVYPA